MEESCDLELGLGLRPHDDRDGGEQFTVMYDGEVCVCENVSKAQAKAILLLASRAEEGERRRRTGASGVNGLILSLDPPPMPQPLLKCSGSAMSAMSMKRSLQRFLEKRRLRMQRSHASPY